MAIHFPAGNGPRAPIRSRNCSPRLPIRFGPGTSPSSRGRPNGPTFTSTRFLTYSAAISSAGYLQTKTDLANDLIAESCLKQEIVPGTLILHSDCGATMKSRAVGHMLADLGITKSLSRPHVSNDNPFVESSYKTLKYRPDFPDRFASNDAGVAFCKPLINWYNNDHRHSGIGMLTPADVHYGRADEIIRARQVTLTRAFKEHPERFVKGLPLVAQVPKEVWINKPNTQNQEQTPNLIKNAILSQTY